MLDTHGRSILLGAIIIFIYNIVFSIFSIVATNVYYKTIFLVFSILNNALGLLFLVIVYFKLYNIVRNILKEDVVLKKILKDKSPDDEDCTFPYCEKLECGRTEDFETCPIYIRESKED